MNKEISPLDGRYYGRLKNLGNYFSEYALMHMRVLVELRFLEALDETGLFEKLNAQELSHISELKENFTDDDYQIIKEIENKINHDVKACEVFLREKLNLKNPNMIHFGLTSEDVNNLSYTFIFKEYLEIEQLPQLKEITNILLDQVEQWKDLAFPCRTHGQMASPSTAGKEFAVFVSRIVRQIEHLKKFSFLGKLNGATGNYSALLAAFPDYDWIEFTKRFMDKHNLGLNLVTTQIEDHDAWALYFSTTRQVNNIILDLNRDVWLYLTLGYLTIGSASISGWASSSSIQRFLFTFSFCNPLIVS